jgi:hypothetical protein
MTAPDVSDTVPCTLAPAWANAVATAMEQRIEEMNTNGRSIVRSIAEASSGEAATLERTRRA